MRFNPTSIAVFLVALACASAALARAEDVVDPPAHEGRPRIGVVLGGGGARGAAHIGVLRVLEELNIPIDCIVGTSMGALVGAAYASGMTSREIEKMVGAINWRETLGVSGGRAVQSVQQKRASTTYSNGFEFGLKRKGLLTQGALLSSQHIDTLLRSIVSRARYHDTFDDLPIPYRAVATDLRSGEMVVLKGGDLSIAMRASMAVPGAFAPVRIGDRLMIDGGLVRNLPVDVARETCADVIIASSLVNPDREIQEFQSPLTVLSQTADIAVKNNERAQLATLTAADVSILITVTDVTSRDFGKMGAAIAAGDLSARALAAQLARYSVSPAAYAQWRVRVARSAARNVQLGIIRELRVRTPQRINPRVLELQLGSKKGAPAEEAQVVADAQRIFARGDFETVDYNITRTADGAVVEFLPVEKPWGPDYVTFDLGLMSATRGDTGYVLRMDHRRTWVNSLGGLWSNTVQLGRSALIRTSLFQPLELRQRYFIEPEVLLARELQDVYEQTRRVARYQQSDFEARLDAGASLGAWGELRAGLRRLRRDLTVDTGDAVLPQFRNVDVSGVSLKLTVDTRDSPYLPRQGTYGHVEVFRTALGAQQSYQKVEMFAQRVVPVRADLLYVELAAGSDFGSKLPVYDDFTLGGPGQLAGFAVDELRGREYASVRTAYLRNLTDAQTLLGRSLYAGLSIEAGNMFSRADGEPAHGMIPGSSLLLGARTPLGPLLISFGIAEGGHKSGYLQLGRPLRER